MEILSLGQYVLTALSSGFNMVYLFGYQTEVTRRRVGALVLGLVNLATFVQSLYFSLLLLLEGEGFLERLLLDTRHWLVIGLLVMLGSLATSALILRQITSPDRRDRE